MFPSAARGPDLFVRWFWLKRAPFAVTAPFIVSGVAGCSLHTGRGAEGQVPSLKISRRTEKVGDVSLPFTLLGQRRDDIQLRVHV